jgi:REP element-mobilizing transposase RayT
VIIFLTVCAEKRKPILANDDAAGVILEAWRDADHWLVGRYIIVPDHIHLFCAPGRRDALPVKNGWRSGRARHQTVGRFLEISLSGRWIVGTRNCEPGKATARSGITCAITRCVMDW